METNRKIELSPRLKLSVGRGLSQNRKLKIIASSLLVLAFALTVNAVRLMFFTSGDKIQNTAGKEQVLGASDTKTPDTEISFTEYTVQKSDTLFNISQKFNISWTVLATLNNLKSPFVVKPGQVLKVPKQ
jgi:LysM repeat protein